MLRFPIEREQNKGIDQLGDGSDINTKGKEAVRLPPRFWVQNFAKKW
jgi:hypothetical protein